MQIYYATLHYTKGCNFLGEFFPVFFWELFPVFWGLMVLIGICSVLHLSSLICMVLLLWLDGWMDGGMDGWMDGWLVGWLSYGLKLVYNLFQVSYLGLV